MHKDSVGYTMLVAASVCVICSLVVSTAAITLRPIQERNRSLDMKRNILVAAGLLEPGEPADIEAQFQQIEPRIVDLDTGAFLDRSERSTETQIANTSADAGSREGQRGPSNYQEVYLLEHEGKIDRVILPVRGMGLWAMMYGLIALDRDLTTIRSLVFYEHGETPGLGGEVDNPRWRAQWVGKQAFDAEGDVRIEVVKGEVDPQTPGAEYKVDGISGATFTSRGVSNLVQFWLGEQGYGPFLDKMRQALEGTHGS